MNRTAKMTSGSSGAGALREGRIVDLIAPAVGEYRQIGCDLRRLGLQEQVIVLTGKAEPVDVSRTQTDEGLARFEFKIDLIADETPQAIDLLAVVGRGANAAVHGAAHGNDLGDATAVEYSEPIARRRPSRAHFPAARWCGFYDHDEGPCRSAVPAVPPASDLKSMILKPSGFQRRVFGSFAGSGVGVLDGGDPVAELFVRTRPWRSALT